MISSDSIKGDYHIDFTMCFLRPISAKRPYLQTKQTWRQCSWLMLRRTECLRIGQSRQFLSWKSQTRQSVWIGRKRLWCYCWVYMIYKDCQLVFFFWCILYCGESRNSFRSFAKTPGVSQVWTENTIAIRPAFFMSLLKGIFFTVTQNFHNTS